MKLYVVLGLHVPIMYILFSLIIVKTCSPSYHLFTPCAHAQQGYSVWFVCQFVCQFVSLFVCPLVFWAVCALQAW